MRRMCKCPNCKTLSPKVESEVAKSIKAEGFECPKCELNFFTPINSPLIEEVEE
jgi:transposase-like protein